MIKVLKEDFLNKAIKKFGNIFTYNLINYKGFTRKIEIICNNGHIFKRTPDRHLKSNGCYKCKLFNINNFLDKANLIHQNKYTYNLLNAKSVNDLIIIKCKNNHEFKQKIYKHLSGQGCAKCNGNVLFTKEQFILKSKLIHDNYDYSLVEYINYNTKVKIICHKHNEIFIFEQTPDNHLHKHGCPKCSKNISYYEKEWLDYCNIPNDKNHRQVLLPNLSNKIKVDGFDPITNTVYEFLGGYWHGDPLIYNLDNLNKRTKTTFKELYNKTIKKEIKIRKAGFNYNFIWEKDWIDFKKRIFL